MKLSQNILRMIGSNKLLLTIKGLDRKVVIQTVIQTVGKKTVTFLFQQHLLCK